MRLLAMITAVVCMLGGSAFAQSYTDSIKVQIDHPVIVNGVELPAGQFTIQIMTPGGGGSAALVVRSASGAYAGVIVNRLTQPNSSNTYPSVSLLRRGDQYLFDKLWLSENVGYEVMGLSGQ